jgi:hypothetical protein
LVAAIGWLTGDVFSAAHSLQGLFVFLYLGVLPLLALRRYGPVPAIALAATLLALESPTLFDRPLNDSGAMVLLALASFEVLHAVRLKQGRAGRWAWLSAGVLFAFAVAYKASTAFVMLGFLAGVVVFGGRESRRQNVKRLLGILVVVAAAQLPVLLWHRHAHGYFGLPQGAPIRTWVRTLPPSASFWEVWEASRTYQPAHPEFPTTTSDLIRQRGLGRALVFDPLWRAADAAYWGFGVGEVLRWTWTLLTAVSAMLKPPRLAARLLLIAALAALSTAAYSHYEERYLYPLRPLMAFAVMEAVWHASQTWSPGRERRIATWAGGAYAAAIGAAALGWVNPFPQQVDAVCLLGFAGYVLARWTHASKAALSQALAAALVAMFALRVPTGAKNLLDATQPRVERDAVLGRFVAGHVPKADAVMTRRRGLSLFAQRATVITPYHTADVCRAARRYRVTWLLVLPEDEQKQPDLPGYARRFPIVAEQDGARLHRLQCKDAGDT